VEPSSPSLGVTLTTVIATLQAMNLPPDQPPPEKPKLSAEERRIRQADRLTTIRLRMAIGRELDEREITTPAAIGEALGMPAAEATKLLNRHQWREGDVAVARQSEPACARQSGEPALNVTITLMVASVSDCPP
jgi:hypothetical protein